MDHRLVDINAIVGFVFVLSKISIFHDTEPAGFKIIIIATPGFFLTHHRIFFWVSSLPDGCWIETHCAQSEHSGVVVGKGCPHLNLVKQISIPVSLAGGPQASALFPLAVESLGFLWRFFCLPYSGRSFPWISFSSRIYGHLEKAHPVLCRSPWHQSSGDAFMRSQSTVLYKMATGGYLVSWSLPPPGSKTQVLSIISAQGDPEPYPPLCLWGF